VGVIARRRYIGSAATDQIVASASNFLVGVVIGRVGGSVELGNYSIAFFVWLILIGFNRAALTEPLIIFSDDLDHRHRLREAARAQLAVAVTLAAGLVAVALVLRASGIGLWSTMLALGLALPALFAQDMWRAVAFGVRRPERALANDVAFIVVQLGLTGVLIGFGVTSAPAFIAAWGTGALAGALVGFTHFRVRPPLRMRTSELRRLWKQSRWLLGDFVTLTGIREMQMLLVALILPRADAGGLRAAESLMGPSTVVKLTGGNLGLPTMTHEFRQGGYPALVASANRYTLWVGGAQWLYCLVMVLVGPELLVLLYGETFTGYGYLVYAVAAQYAIGVMSFGPTIAVKVAELSDRMWLARTVVGVFTVPLSIVIAARHGVGPTAWFAVVTAGALVVANYAVFIPAARPPDPSHRSAPPSRTRSATSRRRRDSTSTK
jgi:O-antigen/teichoic acid export membrane protein